jgi:hypothetical protein
MNIRLSMSVLVTAVTALAAAFTSAAQNNSNQTGLVNVSLGDVNVLNNVNAAVACERRRDGVQPADSGCGTRHPDHRQRRYVQLRHRCRPPDATQAL